MKRSQLERRTPLKRGKQAPSRAAISPATRAQREKAKVCIVTGVHRDEGWVVDPAHLASRAHGGCDDPLCVVGLRREIHEAFDRGAFDLLPYLLAHRMVPELCHALAHYHGDLLGLAARLCGERAFVPERSERAA